MIRFEGDRMIVWLQLDHEQGKKISWPLDEYLEHVKHSPNMPTLRPEAYTSGTIEPMSDQDRAEVGDIGSYEKRMKSVREREEREKLEKQKARAAAGWVKLNG